MPRAHSDRERSPHISDSRDPAQAIHDERTASGRTSESIDLRGDPAKDGWGKALGVMIAGLILFLLTVQVMGAI